MDEDEIEADYPGGRDGLLPGEWFFKGPAGESFAVFATRIAVVLAEFVADAAAVKLVAAHGAVSRVIRGQFVRLGYGETLLLPVPQDGFYALEPGGSVRFIACSRIEM